MKRRKKARRGGSLSLKTERRFSSSRAALMLTAVAVLGLITWQVWLLSIRDERAGKKIGKVLYQYLNTKKAPDRWWLVKTEHSVKMAKELGAKKRGIELLIQEVRDVSPLARNIALSFTNVFPTVFEDGISFTVQEGGVELLPSLGRPEICFVSREQFAKYRREPMFQTLFSWRDDWNAVMCVGMELPSDVLGSVLMHELYHGYCQLVVKREPAKRRSRPWMEEEVAAHELGLAVVNYLTDGKYFDACKAMVERQRSDDLYTFLGTVTIEDLVKLDDSVGATNLSFVSGRFICSFHAANLGFWFLMTNGAPIDEKVRFYSWLDTLVAEK